LADVRRMLDEHCSAREIVDRLESRSKAEGKLLFPIGEA